MGLAAANCQFRIYLVEKSWPVWGGFNHLKSDIPASSLDSRHYAGDAELLGVLFDGYTNTGAMDNSTLRWVYDVCSCARKATKEAHTAEVCPPRGCRLQPYLNDQSWLVPVTDTSPRIMAVTHSLSTRLSRYPFLERPLAAGVGITHNSNQHG